MSLASLEWRAYRPTPKPELRASADGGVILTGYAAVFGKYSENLGGFVEQVDARAFDESLRNKGFVAGLVNHNDDWLLGTTDSDTLTLESDVTGLRYEMTLDPDDPDALRVMAKVKTKKMRGSSFSFTVMPGGDNWSYTDQGFPLRTLLAVRLFDVGPVTFPAYGATREPDVSVALRSLSVGFGLSLDDTLAAASRGELKSLIESRNTEQKDEGIGETVPLSYHTRRWSVGV